MKNKHDIEKLGFTPILRAKYLVILAFLAVMLVISSSFVSGVLLWVTYAVFAFTALIVLGLRQNVRFQKLHKKLRPFIVMRGLQFIVTSLYIALVAFTFRNLYSTLVPYLVYYLLGLATVYQFFGLFSLAARAKKDFPDRCEFC